MKKKATIAKCLERYFSIMSNENISDEVRSTKLEAVRTKLDKFSNALFLTTVASEIKSSTGTFVYKLFLQNIKFMGKL